jgi:hypothetical protein
MIELFDDMKNKKIFHKLIQLVNDQNRFQTFLSTKRKNLFLILKKEKEMMINIVE